jgi:hypothetical protein
MDTLPIIAPTPVYPLDGPTLIPHSDRIVRLTLQNVR